MKFGSALARIAKYRALRSILRGITQGIQEGLTNAYHFSQTIDGNLAKALDTLSTKSLTMKNQLGAAFGSLVTTLEPVIQKIIEFATRAAEAITRLFAIIGGQGGYKKAVDASKQWAENTKAGAGAAKEMRRQLMAFDEINRLDAPSEGGGGGGGSSATDYSKMFEWVDLSNINIDPVQIASTIVGKVRDALNKVSDVLGSYDWKAVGAKIYDGLKRMFTEVDWSGLTASISRFAGSAIGAASALIFGFVSNLWADIKKYFSEKTEEVGGNIVLGVLKGIWDGIKAIGTWIHDNVLVPFVNGFKDAFGIHSPSTVMAEIGEDLVSGLLEGIKTKWDTLTKWFKDTWDKFTGWWEGLSLAPFHIPTPHFTWGTRAPSGAFEEIAASVLNALGLPSAIPTLSVSWYAQGGFPEDGLFMANHGELVGQFDNGRTAVANNEQIIEGIKRGVIEAMTTVMSGSSNQNINVYLDGKQISNAVTRNQRQLSRATGVAMA